MNKNEKVILNLETRVHSIKKIGELLTEFVIHSPRLIKTIDIGEFVKFQNYYKDNFYLAEPLVLTPVHMDYSKDLVHFVIKESGASTKILSNLEVGEKVVAMGAIGEKFDITIFENKKVLFLCSGFRHYLNLFLMHEIFNRVQSAEITLASDNLNKIDEFYRHKLVNYAHHIIDFTGDEKKFDFFIRNNIKNFDCIVLGLEKCDLKKMIYELPILIIDLREAVMQCMMNGLCGRCIQTDKDGNHFFSCGKSRYIIYDKDNPDMSYRLKQTSLMETISYLKLKKHMNS